jgi:anti-sigma regulatory factor (Ser/Thr protein kinase)
VRPDTRPGCARCTPRWPHAGRLDIPGDQLDSLLIVAGELATNAIRHARGRLRLWRDPTALHWQVSDHGPCITNHAVGTTPPTAMHVRGRGMWICRQLSDTLVIRRGDHGHGATVTAVVRLGREPSPRTDIRR